MVTKQTKQVSVETKSVQPISVTKISSQKAKYRKKVSTALKKAITASKRAARDEICKTMVAAAAANNGKLPHAYTTTILEESKDTILSWLTRDILNKSFMRHKAKEEGEPPKNGTKMVQSQTVTKATLKQNKIGLSSKNR